MAKELVANSYGKNLMEKELVTKPCGKKPCGERASNKALWRYGKTKACGGASSEDKILVARLVARQKLAVRRSGEGKKLVAKLAAEVKAFWRKTLWQKR